MPNQQAGLHLCFYYPQIKKLSGAERLILRLAAHLAAQPEVAAVSIVTHYFAPECEPELGPGVQVISRQRRLDRFASHYLNAGLEYLQGPTLLRDVPRDSDVVCFFGPPSLPSLFLARSLSHIWRKRPCLYFCYEPPRVIYSDTAAVVRRLGALGWLARPLLALYKRLDRAFVQRADRVLANGDFGAELIRRAYHRRARVITHGVDFAPASLSAVADLRAHLKLPSGLPVVLTVNHLHPRKRIDLFIQTIAAMQQPALGLVVGTGPEAAALQAQVGRLGLQERVLFCGFLTEDELPAAYALADLYLHTGKQESFGLSVIEALAAGKPVISVAEGGPCDTVREGQSGYLRAADAPALAAACDQLLIDRVARVAMGHFASDDIARRFSWQQGARDFLANFGL